MLCFVKRVGFDIAAPAQRIDTMHARTYHACSEAIRVDDEMKERR